MLLSPGHSPRQVSSPIPDSSIEISTPSTASSASRIVSSAKKRSIVLDEDSYVAGIEKIIERDFFPDIAKLKDRLDWLEAVKTSDPIQIRDAQLKIAERRGRKLANYTPGGSGHLRNRTTTPSSTFTDFNTPGDDFAQREPDLRGLEGDEDGIVEKLGLDEFLRKYTSEDNESFSLLLEKVNRKRKERCGHLLAGENDEAIKSIEDAKRDRITDGYGTSYQPTSTLDGWKFQAKNLLMYNPTGEPPLNEEEKEARLKGLTKEINRANTRFHRKVDARPKEDGVEEVIYAPIAGSTPVPFSGEKGKRYDLEDLKKTPNMFYVESGRKENGYGFLRTPSPAPGVDGSPFITWGDIEGTPLRLENEETPINIGGNGDGPHFKIPNPPARDVKAHSLSRDAARKLRERSNRFKKPPLPSPNRGGSMSPNVRTLSPAAQRFVRNTIFKTSSSSSSVDETLRASYRGAVSTSSTPKQGRSISRFGRDASTVSRSPSFVDGSNSPW